MMSMDTLAVDKPWLMLGDCLKRMAEIPDGSVDMVLCDLPYSVTSCHWDSLIPFELLWEQYNRVVKLDGPVVLTASQPFTSALVMSNVKSFRYEWIWKKQKPTGFLDSRRKPLKSHESVLVFSKKPHSYFPQGTIPVNVRSGRRAKLANGVYGGGTPKPDYVSTEGNFPRSIIAIDTDTSNPHPSAKPVTLMDYLIRTYTNPGDVVLDNCFGSCSTGIAAYRLGRQFIGIEKDETYYAIGVNRMQQEITERLAV